jgi:DNA-binding NtrC family response regulator
MGENILVVEDEETLRGNIVRFLDTEGHHVSSTGSMSEALSMLDREPFDLLLTDICLEDGSGLDLLRESSTISPLTTALVMTGYSSVETAVEAFRNGAHDYLIKPFPFEELRQKIDNIAKFRSMTRQNASLRKKIQGRHDPMHILTKNKSMEEVLAMIHKVASSTCNVLITGETGTGKELVAGAIHSLSLKSDSTFIPMNVAAIPDTLVESYLFGHQRGAFTGADKARDGAFRAAADGTLFLDEIGDLPLHVQPKLLRALEQKEIMPVGSDVPLKVNTRVLAATHRDLEGMVNAGTFRRDLFMRLNVVTIHIPPLRERMVDIPLLVRHFVTRHCCELGKPVMHIDQDTMKCLMSYNWRKGNVRELSNAVERAVILSEGDTINIDTMPAEIRGSEQHRPSNAGDTMEQSGQHTSTNLKEAMAEFEHQHLIAVLESVNGNREDAARVLGISPATMYRHMERLGLKGY